jgi:hypothetical protein
VAAQVAAIRTGGVVVQEVKFQHGAIVREAPMPGRSPQAGDTRAPSAPARLLATKMSLNSHIGGFKSHGFAQALLTTVRGAA